MLEPTRKLIWLSVPPVYRPLMTLPFFNSKVSATANDPARQTHSNMMACRKFIITSFSLFFLPAYSECTLSRSLQPELLNIWMRPSLLPDVCEYILNNED